MTRLILATRNAGKITELHAILADAGLPFDLVGADAYPEIPDVKETGVTFAENALLKAHALAQATGLPAVADDSGLCVDALNGMPGVVSVPNGRPVSLMDLTIVDGRIVEINILADAQRIAGLDLSGLEG